MHFHVAIPNNATETVDTYHANGRKRESRYFQHGELVGYRSWAESGLVEHEYAWRDGLRDGYELVYHNTGDLMAAIPWSRGALNGAGKQWSRDGRLIVEWTVSEGTGVELICSQLVGHEDGEYMSVAPGDPVLAIERHWMDGERNGFERWWAGDNRHITDEMYFRDDHPHGIWRSWTRKGTQRRSFPQYFINGKRVTKRTYMRQTIGNDTLPPLQAEDDMPARPLPEDFVRHLHAG